MQNETTSDSRLKFVPDIRWLIENARRNPAKPIVNGLLNEGEVAGLHGPPEAFKTILTLQLAESIASGKPFLGRWEVPRPRPAFYFETEMSTTALGKRVGGMYMNEPPPQGVSFATEEQLRSFQKAPNLDNKFALLRGWIREAGSEVAILDTCNPFFRGKQSPNEETAAGEFFDLIGSLPVRATLFVRHNHKPREDDSQHDGSSRIRGSGQFADVPDILLEMKRLDKRVNSAVLSCTKFRHGSKPDDLELWFDRRELRLSSLPPVVKLLKDGPLTRNELLGRLEEQFGIAQRKGDDLIEQQSRPGFIIASRDGHNRMYAINWDNIKNADWFEDCALEIRKELCKVAYSPT
jgi:AAA domain-containing protein